MKPIPLDREAYVVLADEDGEEISDRHYGQMFAAVSPGKMDLLFAPEESTCGANGVKLTALRHARGLASVDMKIDGELAHRISTHAVVFKRQEINVNWSLDGMS